MQSLSEITIEVAINLEADDAAQMADKLLKTAWTEMEGMTKFGVSEKFAYLVPSDVVMVETESGVFRRVRLGDSSFVDGVIQFEAVADRASGYVSTVVAPPVVAPETPTSNLPSETTFTIMDLPALRRHHDTLHIYVAATGDNVNAWKGAAVEQLLETEWVPLGEISFPSTIGTLLEELPTHAIGVDTTNDFLVSLSDDAIATITQAEFDIGLNPALINNEIVNIKTVVAEGDNWRLSYLNRGALNSTPATHAISSPITFLFGAARFIMDADFIDQTATFRVYSIGMNPSINDISAITFTGKSQIEWAPLNITPTLVGEDITITWDHNKRIGQPNDSFISKHFEEFAIELTEGVTVKTVFYPTDDITYTNAEMLVDFSGAVTEFDQIRIWGINEFTGAGDIAVDTP